MCAYVSVFVGWNLCVINYVSVWEEYCVYMHVCVAMCTYSTVLIPIRCVIININHLIVGSR